jgi:hypothetical protein
MIKQELLSEDLSYQSIRPVDLRGVTDMENVVSPPAQNYFGKKSAGLDETPKKLFHKPARPIAERG